MTCIAPKNPKKYIYVKKLSTFVYSLMQSQTFELVLCTRCICSRYHTYKVGTGEEGLDTWANEWRKPMMKRKDGKHALDPLAR